MAQMKNNFVKSKMNKDLDDRLLQPGEYRDARNVNVSRSEGDDVGALENVLGNELYTNFSNLDPNVEIIGYLRDEETNSIFAFATDYTDESFNNLSKPAPYNAKCYIFYKPRKGNVKTLVQGRFLNFSKTHKVLNSDLIEDLLFWTDDRNQPRKINWKKAAEDSSYYYDEDHISVAKYYPYQTPLLKKETTLSSTEFELWDSGYPGEDVGSGIPSTYYKIIGANPNLTAEKIKVGMEVICYSTSSGDYSFPKFRAFIVERKPTSAGTPNFPYFKINLNQSLQPLSGDNNLTPFEDNGELTSITFAAATSQNQFDQYLTPHQYIRSLDYAGNTISVNSFSADEVLVGMQITSTKLADPPTITGVVETRSSTSGFITGYQLTLDKSCQDSTINNNLTNGSYCYVSWNNPNYVSSWPGDRVLMEDKFIRFAYRFKFDDGEYSLISPFTQPAFIPKQNGYIVTESTPGVGGGFSDQAISIASSTTISTFENSVNNVDIKIPFEFKCSELKDRLKIEEVDIIYHESEGLAMSIVETIPITDPGFSQNNTNIFTYDYQSKKPFRTLPEKETIRVFDKVPVRAKTQSVSGNRVIYGNILDKHSPPESLPYNVTISEKYTPGNYSRVGENYPDVRKQSLLPAVAYPYHTVKQNRTYQVGIILSDRYGRQTDVVLSSLTNFAQSQGNNDEQFDASTVYHPYPTTTSNGEQWDTTSDLVSSDWRGDSIKLLWTDIIPETLTGVEGYPGLYKPKEYVKEVEENLDDGGAFVPIGDTDAEKYNNVALGDIITAIDLDEEESFIGVVDGVIPSGVNNDYPNGAIFFQPDVEISLEEPVVFHSPGNVLGFYTYKVVVKQQAEDYYNVYLGQITNITTEQVVLQNGGSQSQVQYRDYYCTSLISDNVNKVPADLIEVTPEQTQFGTSDTLVYPRVGAHVKPGDIEANYSNQFHYGSTSASIVAWGKMKDLGFQNPQDENVDYPKSQGVWSASNNPVMIALGMADRQSIGIAPDKTSSNSIFAALEVKPPESRLDIYWETSTTGNILELNNLINGGPNATPIPPDPDPFEPPVIVNGVRYNSCDGEGIVYTDTPLDFDDVEDQVTAFIYNCVTYDLGTEFLMELPDGATTITQDQVTPVADCTIVCLGEYTKCSDSCDINAPDTVYFDSSEPYVVFEFSETGSEVCYNREGDFEGQATPDITLARVINSACDETECETFIYNLTKCAESTSGPSSLRIRKSIIEGQGFSTGDVVVVQFAAYNTCYTIEGEGCDTVLNGGLVAIENSTATGCGDERCVQEPPITYRYFFNNPSGTDGLSCDFATQGAVIVRFADTYSPLPSAGPCVVRLDFLHLNPTPPGQSCWIRDNGNPGFNLAPWGETNEAGWNEAVANNTAADGLEVYPATNASVNEVCPQCQSDATDDQAPDEGD